MVTLFKTLSISDEMWEKALRSHALPPTVSWLEVGVSVLVNISGGDEVSSGDFMPATVLEICETSACVQMKGEDEEEDWEIDVGFDNLKIDLTRDCEVCGETLPLLVNECGHGFCSECWEGYLTVQLREGNGLVPTCAAPKCCLEVSSALAVQALESEEIKERWRRVWSGAVVSKAPDMCACPSPGCEDVVLRLGEEYVCNAQCAEGHSFCWDCKSLDAHGPTPCKVWEEWEVLVREHLAQVMEAGGVLGEEASAQDVGNILWLAANTKKCPKCATRTEKSDGCNHMTCKQCRHDYCWICCKEWSLHSNKTGGYYRCNRFEEEEVVSTDNRGEGSASEEHKKRAAEAVKADRFIHFYTRFSAQEASSKMEQEKRTDSLCKIRLLQRRFNQTRHSESDGEKRKSSDGSGGGDEANSSEEAWALTSELNIVGEDVDCILSTSFTELARCRLALRNSYAFAHVKLSNEEFDKQSRIETRRDRRRSLHSDLRHSSLRCEAAQSELESITETLSEILARRYMV